MARSFLTRSTCFSLMMAFLASSYFLPASADESWMPVGNNNGILISQNLPPLQGRIVTAPAGTYMSATLTSPLSSEYARVGDRFMATLGGDVAAGGSVILPSGSQLEGQVVSVVPAGRAGRHGQLDIRFTSAMLPSGQRIPISAKIETQDRTGIIRGGSTGERWGKAALKTGVGAGLGAALGTAMGPLSGGSVGRGAIYGTAIGGGMGALTAAWQKGDEAVLPAGQPVQIVLDQPLTSSPDSYSAPAYNNYNNYSQPYGAPATNYYNQPAPQYNQYNNQYSQPYNQQPAYNNNNAVPSYGSPYGGSTTDYGVNPYDNY